MQTYANNGGNSNIRAFEIGTDYIDVQFNGGGKVYRYSYKSAGEEKVEYMKELAKRGSGLNSYINRFVKFNYER